jgi:MFS transporter, ACS family, glucarate transporter
MTSLNPSPQLNVHQRRGSIVFLLWAFAFLSYLLRTNIAVAQQYMARELQLSDIQVGYIFSAFLIGYTIFQVPAGALGDRYGPRMVLTVSGLCWAATTLLTGLVPGLLLKGSVAALGSLVILRFVHGVVEAPTFPVAMNAVAEWFEPERHAFITSVIFTGSTLGSAFAPPLVANIMAALGWRATFYVTAVFPIAIAVVWWRKGKHERPVEAAVVVEQQPRSANWWTLLLQWNIFFLCLSYFLYCYAISIFVYWLFKYLVDVRHLSIVNSGWATSLPWIFASIAVPALGYASARVSKRLGKLTGRRLIAAGCLVIAAFLMSVGVGAQTIGVAIGTLTLSVALLFSTESSYWSTAIDLAPDEAGASGGLMNLAGNLGAVLATTLVPVLVAHVGWFYALSSGSLFAIVAAATWFLIRKEAAI